MLASTKGSKMAAHSPDEALFSQVKILTGESDATGKLNLSAAEAKRLQKAYTRSPRQFWIVTPGKVKQLVLEQASTAWSEQDKLYHSLDALGYTDGLKKAGDTAQIDPFHSVLAKDNAKTPTGSALLDQLKGKKS